ncbi:hypothetical protein R1sor_022344 [Riccia sorocarpa]|uniref:S-adenosyl-L-methionine-dependent methyltransferase n=1 Tax=Riccia sorocarpa TaxID=122646 RepID=A0ABD3GKA7_9MARC
MSSRASVSNLICSSRRPAMVAAAGGELQRKLQGLLGWLLPVLSNIQMMFGHDPGLNTERKVETAVTDFVLDGSKTTSIAHKVWRSVVRPGDTVIDATCGNGHDTLELARLVIQDENAGFVIGLDLQQSAIDNTTSLLDRELEPKKRGKVNLLQLCHSQLDKIVDEASVRLVCFNLGYQPGGDKSFITRAESTVSAVRAAAKVIQPQGLISIMSYVGHPGGQEEFEAVREFVASLPSSDWVCSHLEWTNRPLCPHLIFVLRK